MGKPTGFLEIERRDRGTEKPEARRKGWREFVTALPYDEVSQQAARCMDCGIPFCHTGCPVNNMIPDWNNLVYRDQWRAALDMLHSTNNFPEFTGRVCPAPCETSCTLNIDDNPVTIKTIECQIVDRGWEEGWIKPLPAARKTGKNVAVVGSGPAGLACAQQLARAGHQRDRVRKERPYWRVAALRHSRFQDGKAPHRPAHAADGGGRCCVPHRRRSGGGGIGVDAAQGLRCAGAVRRARKSRAILTIEGRELSGIHFAMDFLTQQNKRVAGDDEARAAPQGTLSAKGKHVVVIGGGDTGSDCIGTSNRHGAASITQLEILSRPPEHENKALAWPDWPLKLRTSSSHEEGCDRDWSVLTKRAIGGDGAIQALGCVRVEWQKGTDGRMQMVEMPHSAFELKADLVLLAMGFVGPHKQGLVEQSGVERDGRGNVKANVIDYKTSRAKRLCVRRHAARAIAGRVGDPRGPAMRARRGSLADGPKRASALERDTVGAIHTHDGELGEALFVGLAHGIDAGRCIGLGLVPDHQNARRTFFDRTVGALPLAVGGIGGQPGWEPRRDLAVEKVLPLAVVDRPAILSLCAEQQLHTVHCMGRQFATGR